jgi:hypothetical protein
MLNILILLVARLIKKKFKVIESRKIDFQFTPTALHFIEH